jgi:hypothetical protein
MFSLMYADILTQRQTLGLPDLVTSSILVGKEWLAQQMAPPRIVVVPVGVRFAPNTPGGQSGDLTTGSILDRVQRSHWWQLLEFEAHFWGDPQSAPGNPPSVADQLYDFATCYELERQFLGALVRYGGGIPNVQLGRAEFRQPTDDVRFGRLLVLPFAVGTSVADGPYTFIPFSSVQIPGSTVQVSATVTLNSTAAGTFLAP